MRMRWTLDLQFRLATMSANGLSATAIAAELGETRSTIASGMHRYGLFASGVVCGPRPGAKPRRKGKRITLAKLAWMEAP